MVVVASSGAGIAEIATTLFLSSGTVRNYLSLAIQKLDARNRFEAARLAKEKGWIWAVGQWPAVPSRGYDVDEESAAAGNRL